MGGLQIESNGEEKMEQGISIELGYRILDSGQVGELQELELAKAGHLLIAGSGITKTSEALISHILKSIGDYPPDHVELFAIGKTKLFINTCLENITCRKVLTSLEEIPELLIQLASEYASRKLLMIDKGCRNIIEFNSLGEDKFAHIFFVVEELDMLCGQKVNEQLLATMLQKFRSMGIYLILKTARPSVNVLTGLIKANCANRIAWKAATAIDAKVILDWRGAEELAEDELLLSLPMEKDFIKLKVSCN